MLNLYSEIPAAKLNPRSSAGQAAGMTLEKNYFLYMCFVRSFLNRGRVSVDNKNHTVGMIAFNRGLFISIVCI